MMIKMITRSEGVTIVNMVRKEEGADLLKSLGAEYVVVTGKEGWEEEMKQLIKKLNISVVFDAIAGDMSGKMMKMLPSNSTTIVYGGLSGSLFIVNYHSYQPQCNIRDRSTHIT